MASFFAMMHPPLYKPHPLCEEEIQNLVRCHEENPVSKIFGACNKFKVVLDKCMREEKKLRRKVNKQKRTKGGDRMLY